MFKCSDPASTFLPSHIKNVISLLSKLRNGTDPVSEHLRQRKEFAYLLELPGDSPVLSDSKRTSELLSHALNKIITGPSIYDEKRFNEIRQREKTKELLDVYFRDKNRKLLDKKYLAEGPGQLNRCLLEDAYPRELSRNTLKAPFIAPGHPLRRFRTGSHLLKELGIAARPFIECGFSPAETIFILINFWKNAQAGACVDAALNDAITSVHLGSILMPEPTPEPKFMPGLRKLIHNHTAELLYTLLSGVHTRLKGSKQEFVNWIQGDLPESVKNAFAILHCKNRSLDNKAISAIVKLFWQKTYVAPVPHMEPDESVCQLGLQSEPGGMPVSTERPEYKPMISQETNATATANIDTAFGKASTNEATPQDYTENESKYDKALRQSVIEHLLPQSFAKNSTVTELPPGYQEARIANLRRAMRCNRPAYWLYALLAELHRIKGGDDNHMSKTIQKDIWRLVENGWWKHNPWETLEPVSALKKKRIKQAVGNLVAETLTYRFTTAEVAAWAGIPPKIFSDKTRGVKYSRFIRRAFTALHITPVARSTNAEVLNNDRPGCAAQWEAPSWAAGWNRSGRSTVALLLHELETQGSTHWSLKELLTIKWEDENSNQAYVGLRPVKRDESQDTNREPKDDFYCEQFKVVLRNAKNWKRQSRFVAVNIAGQRIDQPTLDISNEAERWMTRDGYENTIRIVENLNRLKKQGCKFKIVHGAAGRGKSTWVAKYVQELTTKHLDVLVVGPTGRSVSVLKKKLKVSFAKLFPEDIIHPRLLLSDLTLKNNPVSAYLWQQFDQTDRQMALSCNSSIIGDQNLRKILSQSLNKLITTTTFNQCELFMKCAGEETRKLIGGGGDKEPNPLFNRSLLEDAYSLRFSNYLVSYQHFTTGTIHSTFSIDPDSDVMVAKGSPALKTAHTVIIDEMSMVSEYVLSWLLMGVCEAKEIIFVGDPAQLPSVENGEVFRELVDLAEEASLIQEEDINNLDIRFAKSLVFNGECVQTLGRDPISCYLWESLGEASRFALKQVFYRFPMNEISARALREDLNRVIRSDTFYDYQRFARITLSSETERLIELKLRDAEPSRIRLNRMLLHDAYPGMFSDPKPEVFQCIELKIDHRSEGEALKKATDAIRAGEIPTRGTGFKMIFFQKSPRISGNDIGNLEAIAKLLKETDKDQEPEGCQQCKCFECRCDKCDQNEQCHQCESCLNFDLKVKGQTSDHSKQVPLANAHLVYLKSCLSKVARCILCKTRIKDDKLKFDGDADKKVVLLDLLQCLGRILHESRAPSESKVLDENIFNANCVVRRKWSDGAAFKHYLRPVDSHLLKARLVLESTFPRDLENYAKAAKSKMFIVRHLLLSTLTFSAESFPDIESFANKLLQPQDAVSEFLSGRLSKETCELLVKLGNETCKSPANDELKKQVLESLKKYLVLDLNNVIRGAAIYDGQRFAKVKMRLETKTLLDHNPQKGDLMRLNRLLIEDAYPVEILANQKAFAIAPLRKQCEEIGDLLAGAIWPARLRSPRELAAGDRVVITRSLPTWLEKACPPGCNCEYEDKCFANPEITSKWRLEEAPKIVTSTYSLKATQDESVTNVKDISESLVTTSSELPAMQKLSGKDLVKPIVKPRKPRKPLPSSVAASPRKGTAVDIYNATSGTVEYLCKHPTSKTKPLYVRVKFDNVAKPVAVERSMLVREECRTVHSWQGGEHGSIIALLTHSRITNRQLLYTIVSRAKKQMTLVVENEEYLKLVLACCPSRNTILTPLLRASLTDANT